MSKKAWAKLIQIRYLDFIEMKARLHHFEIFGCEDREL